MTLEQRASRRLVKEFAHLRFLDASNFLSPTQRMREGTNRAGKKLHGRARRARPRNPAMHALPAKCLGPVANIYHRSIFFFQTTTWALLRLAEREPRPRSAFRSGAMMSSCHMCGASSSHISPPATDRRRWQADQCSLAAVLGGLRQCTEPRTASAGAVSCSLSH